MVPTVITVGGPYYQPAVIEVPALLGFLWYLGCWSASYSLIRLEVYTPHSAFCWHEQEWDQRFSVVFDWQAAVIVCKFCSWLPVPFLVLWIERLSVGAIFVCSQWHCWITSFCPKSEMRQKENPDSSPLCDFLDPWSPVSLSSSFHLFWDFLC